MNGLYDAALDGAPVVALTGPTFHDLRGLRYQQGIDTVKLMEPLAVCNEEVTGPEHALIIGNRACRAALADRGVAHLAISKDVQMMKRSADKRSLTGVAPDKFACRASDSIIREAHRPRFGMINTCPTRSSGRMSKGPMAVPFSYS